MPIGDKVVHITLDPPYRLRTEDETFIFIGWAEVDDPKAPSISLSLTGIAVPVVVAPKPEVREHFPDLEAAGFYAQVNFKQLFADLPASAVAEPFLLEATVRSDDRERTFEYAVTEDWLRHVFGRGLKARRIPPEALQIRVTGSAAGAFHRAGRRVAEQIAGLLAASGYPLQGFRRILDFGSGPGRVVSSIRDLHPAAKLSASDIDPEAIAWASEALADVAVFVVNPTEPPAPFPDEAFDLIYAISVFTHLPEAMQWAWLADLRRMLRPGGILLTTKLNAAAYDLPPEVKAEAEARGFVYWGDSWETDGLPSFYRLAYHTHGYVAREWGRYFEVLHIGSHDLNDTQDAIVLRRPRHALSWLPPKVRKGLHRLLRGRGA
jgi:SAM-dependent methyltransferase